MIAWLKNLFRNHDNDWVVREDGYRWRVTRSGGIEVDPVSLMKTQQFKDTCALIERMFQEARARGENVVKVTIHD